MFDPGNTLARPWQRALEVHALFAEYQSEQRYQAMIRMEEQAADARASDLDDARWRAGTRRPVSQRYWSKEEIKERRNARDRLNRARRRQGRELEQQLAKRKECVARLTEQLKRGDLPLTALPRRRSAVKPGGSRVPPGGLTRADLTLWAAKERKRNRAST